MNIIRHKLLLIVIALAAVLSAFFYVLSYPSIQRIQDHSEKKLSILESIAEQQLDSIYHHLHHSSKKDFVYDLSNRYKNLYNEKGIAFFIYENDSLQFWTDNHPAVENYMLNVCLEKKIVKLKNGYYQVIKHHQNAFSPFQLYGLILIKNGFAYQNKYLKNSFNPFLDIPHQSDLIEIKTANKNSIEIVNKEKQFLFSLELHKENRNQLYSFLSFFSCILSLGLGLFFLRKQLNPEQSIKNFIRWMAFILVTALILYLYLFYANGLYLYLPSLNELDAFVYPVFIVCLLFMAIWVLWTFKACAKQVHSKATALWPFMALSLLLYIFGNGINFFLQKIFSQPYLSADLADIFFNPSLNVYLSYACVFLLFFCFSLLAEIGLQYLTNDSGKIKKYILFLSISLLSIYFNHLLAQYNVFKAIWPGLFFILLYFAGKHITNNQFLYGILICFIISFFGSYLTIDLKNHTDFKQRLELAEDLIDPKDEVVENLFNSINGSLVKDHELQKLILKKDKNTNNPEQYILRKYFMGYWERYHVTVCVFDSICNPLIPQSTHVFNNNTYFDDIISTKLVATGCEGLYFNNILKDKTYYLFHASLPFAHKPYQIYVIVESKRAPDHRGFPDLLLNQSAQLANTEYSYAVYRYNHLHEKQGPYEYPSVLSHEAANESSYNENGFNHFVYAPNSSSLVIVSKNYTYLKDLSATLSFLFLAGSTSFLLFFIPVAINAFVLAKEQTEAQNIEGIKEKIQTVSNYLSIPLSNYDSLHNGNKEYIAYLLRQASALFKNDITLFDKNGEYYAAGLPKLFDEGILSKKINPMAYTDQLSNKIEKKVYNENIGKLNFYSAYNPLQNENGHKLAILNMPYFSKQNEIQAQLFGYLSALFNIYVLSFMLVSIAAALLSNWLTRPLQQLQVQLKKVTLTQNNEPIRYEKNDEIGLLISSYNNMLIKLQQSANQLSKSEREGAWKEMAKQVAHEIKNPLTPMKLSIQHIERLIQINPEKAKEYSQQIIPVLLGQIDALAHIASEFSDFAKLPTPHYEHIDLIPFLKNSLSIYQSHPGIALRMDTTLIQAPVQADKDQLLRVINNLVNNAIQSITEKGEIILGIEEKNNSYLISVTDTGMGISDSNKNKIFQPNFSTKSFGTGLGLAMCKRIIEQHGGEIWFESESGKGATFSFTVLKTNI